MVLIVDLDDTLVSSTKLNNDAYNFALEKYGYDRLKTAGRITREKLKWLDNQKLSDIVVEKQIYFSQKWLPYRIVLNKRLLQTVKKIGKKNCYIWTKADNRRARAIISLCKLKRFFKGVIFDDKTDFNKSIKTLKKLTKAKSLIIYENNKEFFKNQRVEIVETIKDKNFDISAYLV